MTERPDDRPTTTPPRWLVWLAVCVAVGAFLVSFGLVVHQALTG